MPTCNHDSYLYTHIHLETRVVHTYLPEASTHTMLPWCTEWRRCEGFLDLQIFPQKSHQVQGSFAENSIYRYGTICIVVALYPATWMHVCHVTCTCVTSHARVSHHTPQSYVMLKHSYKISTLEPTRIAASHLPKPSIVNMMDPKAASI